MSFDVASYILDTYLSTLFAGLEDNFDFPEEILSLLHNNKEDEYYHYTFGSWPLVNASVTIILMDIKSRMPDVINEVKDSALFRLSSGHDHNFFDYFLLFLGMNNGYALTHKTSPFEANLMFELLKSKWDGHDYVRVRYNNEFLPTHVCSTEPCPLDEFD